MPTTSRALLAEFLGTALLVVGGVGTAVVAGDTVGDLGVALAFGFTLLALAYALGPVSGCHVNPAVTLGMALSGRISPGRAGGYAVAQVLGGLAGAGLVATMVAPGHSIAQDGIGANGYGAASTGGYGAGAVFGVEVLLTFVLVFVVLAVTDRVADAAFAGIPIGLTLVVLHLIAIPIDGTSVNPARSVGPALFGGATAVSQLWVFVLAPLAGGVLAALAHRALFTATDAPVGPGPQAQPAAR